ncbi:MAG TPA: hypothetical protein VHC47_10955 [Mucilaginibacter sp.]|nr:hypothetical protein [Mucilaginibacter sp.]
MKRKTNLILALIAGSIVLFSACKKSSKNPSGPAITPKQVSSQVAQTLVQMLYSGFGAFNLSEGLNAPNSLGLVHNQGKLKLNSNDNPLCGLIADTTLNYSTSAGGVQASVKGELKFSFTCTNGVFSGFNITDNLAVSESSSDFTANVKLAEDLTLLSQNPLDDNSNILLTGSFSSDGTYTYKSGTAAQNFSFTLNSVIIDANGNIVSGSATFATNGSGTTGSWNYSGSIKFLGNGKATITISGTTYNVDLQTGQVS